MVSEAIAFLLRIELSERPTHQSLMEPDRCHKEVSMCTSWNQSFSNPHSPDGEATFVEEVVHRLLLPLSKRAEATVRPSTLLQSIRPRYLVLDSQPSEELYLGRCPSLPHSVSHWELNSTMELCFISRLGRMLPASGVFPDNLILGIIVKMESPGSCAKGHKHT